MNERIAIRYAKALFDVATERNQLDRVMADMTVIHDTLAISKELRAVLHNPVVRPQMKRNVLVDLFRERISVDTMQFLNLLVHKGRTELIDETASEYLKLLDTVRNTVRVKVSSAIELDTKTKEGIVARLKEMTGKTVEATFWIEKDLIGGFIIKIGDTLIDGSLRHQLDLLKKEFMTGGPVLN